MSRKSEALQMLLAHPLIAHILGPFTEGEIIDFDNVNYGALSGGERVAISWVYAIYNDKSPPATYRDPFGGFGVLDAELQNLVLKALVHRHKG